MVDLLVDYQEAVVRLGEDAQIDRRVLVVVLRQGHVEGGGGALCVDLNLLFNAYPLNR